MEEEIIAKLEAAGRMPRLSLRVKYVLPHINVIILKFIPPLMGGMKGG